MPLTRLQKVNLNFVTQTSLQYRRGEGFTFFSNRLLARRDRFKSQLQDDDVTAVLDRRVGVVVGRRNLIKTGGDRPKDKDAAEKAAKIMARMPYERITGHLLDAIHYGYAVAYIKDWAFEDGLYIPQLEGISQDLIEFVPYNPDDTTPYDCDLSLNPETEIAVYRGHEVRLRTGRSPFLGERVPKDRFIVFSYGGGDSEPLGLGLAYRFQPLIDIKRAAMEAWVLECDRLGSPPTIGTHPSNLNKAQEASLIGKWQAFLEGISPNGWIDLPMGFAVQLLETGSNATGETQSKLIKACSDAIYKAGIGEVPISQTNHGSYGANQAQIDDREMCITDRDCEAISSCLAEQLWRPIGDVNWKGVAPPIIKRWTTEDAASVAEDRDRQNAKKAEADTMNAIANFWNTMINQVGFTPTKELAIATFGEGWVLPGVTDSASTDTAQVKPKPQNAVTEMGEFAEPIKRVVKWQGLEIGLQYDIGDVRHDKPMAVGYGHFRKLYASNGDGKSLDVLVGLNLNNPTAYEVQQVGSDTEPKIIVGVGSEGDAIATYLYHYPEDMYGGIRAVTPEELQTRYQS